MIQTKKAKDLIIKFYDNDIDSNISEFAAMSNAKTSAIISVDEIIEELKRIDTKFNLGLEGTMQYWDKVKKEIELF